MQHQTTLQLEPEPKLDDNVVQLGDENEEKWLDALKELKQAKEISLDLETYGEENEQDGLNPWRGKVRLMQIGLPSGLVIVVDFGSPFHDRASRWKLIKTRLMPILRPILESRNVLKLFHNGKFDMLYLLVQFGIRVRRVFDSMLASQLIRAGLQSKGLHTLKRVANDFLGIEVDKQQQNSSWSAPNLSNAQINYGAEDARVLHPLKQKLKERLQQDRLIRQAKIEMNALPAIVEMIYNGVPVDVSEVDEAIEKYENCRQDILKPFYEAFGENANPDMDPNQLVELAREKLGVDISSTKKDELAFHKGVPALRALGLARSLKKQIDQLETIKEAEHNGRVCGDIVQIAPKGFGRITCKKGAIGGMILQQIPKPLTDPEIKPYNLPPIRSLFRAPDGYKLLVDDLSQAHMRIATEASQDENLLEIYQNRQDFHSITASKLASQQGLDWSAEQILEYKEDKSHENHDKAKLLRDISKNANYGGINVQGYKTLQSTCRNAGTFISDEEAQNGIEAFRNLAPRLYNYQRTLHKNACDTNLEFEGQQYAWTRSWSGRLVYLPKKPNDYKGGRLEPKISDVCAVNWTSTEADSLKHSVGIEGFLKDIDEHPEWGCELCIIVHDESVALVKEDYAEEAAAYLKQRMHEGMQLFVKSIPVDEEDAKPEDCICDTWLEK